MLKSSKIKLAIVSIGSDLLILCPFSIFFLLIMSQLLLVLAIQIRLSLSIWHSIEYLLWIAFAFLNGGGGAKCQLKRLEITL